MTNFKYLPTVMCAAIFSQVAHSIDKAVNFTDLVDENAKLPAVQIYKAELELKNKNYKGAVNHYLESVKLGYTDAISNIIDLVNSKKINGSELDDAISSISHEAKNNPSLSLYLGRLYETDLIGINKNKAFFWYNNAYKLGDVIAEQKVADYITHDEGDSRKYYKPIDAAVIYKRLADEDGDMEAALKLGTVLLEGKITAQNLKMAISYYRLAAANNVVEAYYHLGYIHEKGIGVDRDINKAIDFYQNSLGGRLSAESYYQLARIYIYGIAGYQKNMVEGLMYMKESANLGSPDANYRMGLMHLYGSEHVKVDTSEAVRYLRASSDKGYRLATVKLLEIYKNGHQGINVDSSEIRALEKKLIK